MTRKIKIALSLAAILIAASVYFVIAQAPQQKLFHAGGPYYYERISADYSSPKTPVAEIQKKDVHKYNSYIEAYFGNDGRITSITKYVGSKVWFQEWYSYNEDGEVNVGSYNNN